jgi:hypothetical protein
MNVKEDLSSTTITLKTVFVIVVRSKVRVSSKKDPDENCLDQPQLGCDFSQPGHD